jgi:uncharacterized protein YdhG (YjbR/CyaY superfamily)
MDDAVREYLEAIDPPRRQLFDRLHGLVLEAYPDVTVALSYGMPTYRVGRRRLHLGVWKHGVSIYGWDEARDGGFLARHPELRTSRGTIQVRPEAAEGITDREFRALLRSALDG